MITFGGNGRQLFSYDYLPISIISTPLFQIVLQSGFFCVCVYVFVCIWIKRDRKRQGSYKPFHDTSHWLKEHPVSLTSQRLTIPQYCHTGDQVYNTWTFRRSWVPSHSTMLVCRWTILTVLSSVSVSIPVASSGYTKTKFDIILKITEYSLYGCSSERCALLPIFLCAERFYHNNWARGNGRNRSGTGA